MKKLILGIDEAGRGPVIGPMIICGVVVEKRVVSELARIGVRDSKLLSPEKRERLKSLIEERAMRWEFVEITPSEIDRYGISLPQIKGICYLIDKLCPHVVFIDAPTSNPASYKRKLKALLKEKKIELVVENFADRKYSIVSAASIMAKVERDKHIKALSLKYGDIGSGYPSDKRTIEFLKKCMREKRKFPEIVRKRWKTAKVISRELRE